MLKENYNNKFNQYTMSRDTCYEQSFKCGCKAVRKRIIWLSMLDKQKCDCCKKKMTPIFEEPKPQTPGIIISSKHAKGRSPQEREKRRTDHFVKEVLPTLPTQDKLHFKNKLNLDKNGKKKK